MTQELTASENLLELSETAEAEILLVPIEDAPDDKKFWIEQLQTSPNLLYLHNFMTEEECDHIITRGRDRIEPSTTVDPETGELKRVDARTSSSTYFMLGDGPIISGIEQRIADITRIPIPNGEGMQILNYQVGQGYLAHFDFFDPLLKGSEVVLAFGGQRVATCIMYLSDVPEDGGGETAFPERDIKIRPKKGDAILFYNVLPDGQVDRMSLHASLPLLVGEKWVATKWLRERIYASP